MDIGAQPEMVWILLQGTLIFFVLKKKCSHSLLGKIHKKLSGMNGPESPHFTAEIS